jgi:hypothetical protein
MQMQLSVHVFLYSVILVIMLKRSPQIGQLILMIQEMLDELSRFLASVGLIVGLFILLGRLC